MCSYLELYLAVIIWVGWSGYLPSQTLPVHVFLPLGCYEMVKEVLADLQASQHKHGANPASIPFQCWGAFSSNSTPPLKSRLCAWACAHPQLQWWGQASHEHRSCLYSSRLNRLLTNGKMQCKHVFLSVPPQNEVSTPVLLFRDSPRPVLSLQLCPGITSDRTSWAWPESCHTTAADVPATPRLYLASAY